MFYKDHEPAHFHAEYQGQNATFDFIGKMLAGNIQSKRALRLISRVGDTAQIRTRCQLGEHEGRQTARQDSAPRIR
jgi:hypothetical protein